MARVKLRNPKMWDFIEWLVDPIPREGITSQADYGRSVGVANTTLSGWKREPEFRAAWEARLAELAQDPKRTQTVLNALYDRASKGDVQAGKEYREWVNRFQRDAPVEDDITSLTDAELEEAFAEAVTEAIARRGGLDKHGRLIAAKTADPEDV